MITQKPDVLAKNGKRHSIQRWNYFWNCLFRTRPFFHCCVVTIGPLGQLGAADLAPLVRCETRFGVKFDANPIRRKLHCTSNKAPRYSRDDNRALHTSPKCTVSSITLNVELVKLAHIVQTYFIIRVRSFRLQVHGRTNERWKESVVLFRSI